MIIALMRGISAVTLLIMISTGDCFNSYSWVRIQRRLSARIVRKQLPQQRPSIIHRHRDPFSYILHLKDDSKPDYENIHGPLGKTIDDIFLSVFRSKMAEKVKVFFVLVTYFCLLGYNMKRIAFL